jgi:hypothetical protein
MSRVEDLCSGGDIPPVIFGGICDHGLCLLLLPVACFLSTDRPGVRTTVVSTVGKILQKHSLSVNNVNGTE